ncbi:hypothetical protein GF380_00590 [Candidatus Uhrbacteria bacterium]|nr:hypothetical protein [Candidatus Uhrbacteria bacterium]
MDNAFTSQFDSHLRGVYSCFDRVIVRGYIHPLFCAGGLIRFLRDAGFRKFTNGVMRIFTDQLNAHVEKIAKRQGIDILWWPSVDGGRNGAKQAYVEKHYVRQKDRRKGNFIYGIIADMERTQSFATRTLQKKNGDPFDKMYKCSKIVKHYYIYFHDQLLGGPCYLKLCTYFPFNAEFYFNGHNAVRLQLDRQGIGYRMHRNAFTWVEDLSQVQQIAFSLSGQQVLERINYWMDLLFRFAKGSYSTRPSRLRHDWYLSQTEICSNILFKSSRFGTGVFERILDKYARVGQPDSLVQIFKKRSTRKDTRSVHRLYDHHACVKHWLCGNSIKTYNKCGFLLRIESTFNSPKSLGLHKHLLYMRDYLRRGIESNDRLLSRYADLDTGSLSAEDATRFNQPLPHPNGSVIAAPDLRKSRQAALFRSLLNPKYASHGFRTGDLWGELGEFFENLGQIRYELQKLRVRGLVEKIQGKQRYRLTEAGFRILWAKWTSNSYFCDPVITKTYRKEARRMLSQPSKIEEAYALLDRGLSLITQELFMNPAA